MSEEQVTVDARGLACPIPVLRVKKALDGITRGTVVVLVDEQVAVENIMRLAAHMGCSLQCTPCEDGFRMAIEKPEANRS
jgi:TusA-related sulfurtransferase